MFKQIFGQMILHFQKEMNVIVYIIIIIIKYTLIISSGKNANEIGNFKIDVCVMFKMKYWINIMHRNTCSQQVR
jgi:hypothetical protein